MCGARTKKNTDHEPHRSGPRQKGRLRNTVPASSVADPYRTYHLDTDPDPGNHGFSTRKIFKI